MDHGMANIEPGLRLHFVAAGDGDFTAVLLHGFSPDMAGVRRASGLSPLIIVEPAIRRGPLVVTTSSPWPMTFAMWAGTIWASVA